MDSEDNVTNLHDQTQNDKYDRFKHIQLLLLDLHNDLNTVDVNMSCICCDTKIGTILGIPKTAYSSILFSQIPPIFGCR